MVKKGKAEGDEASYNASGSYFAPAITPLKVSQYLKNVHLATQIENQQVQIFPGPPEITVVDENEEIDDPLTEWMRETGEKVSLYASMQISWFECLGYGCSVKSPGYQKKGGKLEMTEIRNLPAFRFSQYPGHGTVQNELVPGIVINDIGETEVYQASIDGAKQTRINNFALIIDPTAPKPAGEAYALPIYPLIAAINHTNKASDQQVNRIGAPIVFPQLERTTPEIVAWSKTFVQKWGKDTSFVIPDGVTFPDVKIRETRTAEDRLKLLVQWIESYFNPTTVLQKGNSMGASDKGASQVWANYIGGTQAWIEHVYERFFKPLLEANGYDNRYVKIRLKRPELDRSAEMREQIKIGIEGKAITTAEIRENLSELNLKDTDDEVLKELEEQYKSAPAPPMFGNVVPPQQQKQEETTEKRINRAHDKAEKRLLKLIGED
jgi:hypothetical protein